MKVINIGNIQMANNLPFVLIAGPCQLESRDHALFMMESIKKITDKLAIPFIYKTSYDKANRTSLSGVRGAGLEASIPVFEELRQTVPVLTDVHSEEQIAKIAPFVDVLQIPAFLCRQTDLLIAAAKTGKVINVKKGQFLAPTDMKNVAEKISSSGNSNIILTDRGNSFGYNTLVSDMRSFPIMAETGYPVVIDATHSIQQPGGLGGSSGGERRFIETIASASVASIVAGVFMEVHQEPESAPSDGKCMLELHNLERLLVKLQKIDRVVKGL
jgi:2-dehydro-3-deoxyphosphooctonate aldolase (KDO 8-P synthase)